jgi:ABC-type branched-subunit amino acid transport system substrate-binding protein
VELVAKAVDAASMFWQSLEPRERAALGYLAAWALLAMVAAARRVNRDRLKAELLEELVADGRRT